MNFKSTSKGIFKFWTEEKVGGSYLSEVNSLQFQKKKYIIKDLL